MRASTKGGSLPEFQIDLKFKAIIVAILVCGILVVIFLFLKHKWFSNGRARALENHQHQSSDDTCSSTDHQGADQSEKCAHHSITISPGPLPSTAESVTPLECESCAICLGDYIDGDKVSILTACNHVFHKECIDQWIPAMSLRCPVCRAKVLELMRGEPSGRRSTYYPPTFGYANSNGHSLQLI